jgi:acetolactate synthase-1/2/3 large subunit
VAGIAKGYGIEGKSISKREDVKTALKEMLNHKGSYLLEVIVGKENNVFPMVPQGRGVSEVVLSKEEITPVP